MILCAAGDSHGALDKLYDDVLAFEDSLGVCFDWVLHVGDFGIWPDPTRVDKATRGHDGAGDFHRWLSMKKQPARKTVFIKGNHEDFIWLDQQPTPEIVPGLFYLRNGETMELTTAHDHIRVGGLGGCFGPSDYEKNSRTLQGYARRHYTRDEVEKLGQRPKTEIVLFHDAPRGIEFVQKRRNGAERRYSSTAEGLAEALALIQPRICFFGHHHTRITAKIAGTECHGLNKVGRPGNLVAIELKTAPAEPSILGEWPLAM